MSLCTNLGNCGTRNGETESKLKPNDMNVLDHYVTKIIKNVHQKKVCGDLWYAVKVESDCYGKKTTGTLLFETEGEAKQVKVGYVFQA